MTIGKTARFKYVKRTVDFFCFLSEIIFRDIAHSAFFLNAECGIINSHYLFVFIRNIILTRYYVCIHLQKYLIPHIKLQK